MATSTVDLDALADEFLGTKPAPAAQAAPPPTLPPPRPGRHPLSDPTSPEFQAEARKYGHDPEEVGRLMRAESALNPRAQSPKGAQGVFQLMPSVQQDYGVTDPFDPGQNVPAGLQYLRDLKKRFPGDPARAYAAWSAGASVVERLGRVPNYPETIGLISKVLPGWRYGQGGSAQSMAKTAAADPVDLEQMANEFLGLSATKVAPAAAPTVPGPPAPVSMPGTPAAAAAPSTLLTRLGAFFREPPSLASEANKRPPAPPGEFGVGAPLPEGAQGPPTPAPRMEEALQPPGLGYLEDLSRGGREGVGNVAHQFANAAMLLHKFAGVLDPEAAKPENWLAQSEQVLRSMEDWMRVNPEAAKDRTRFDQQLVHAIGSAAPQLAALFGLSTVTGPVAAMGLLSALSAADKGVVASIWAGIKGAAIGGAYKVLGLANLPQWMRVVGGGNIAGTATLLETGDRQKALVDWLIGAGMMLPGGHPSPTLRETYQRFSDWVDSATARKQASTGAFSSADVLQDATEGFRQRHTVDIVADDLRMKYGFDAATARTAAQYAYDTYIEATKQATGIGGQTPGTPPGTPPGPQGPTSPPGPAPGRPPPTPAPPGPIPAPGPMPGGAPGGTAFPRPGVNVQAGDIFRDIQYAQQYGLGQPYIEQMLQTKYGMDAAQARLVYEQTQAATPGDTTAPPSQATPEPTEPPLPPELDDLHRKATEAQLTPEEEAWIRGILGEEPLQPTTPEAPGQQAQLLPWTREQLLSRIPPALQGPDEPPSLREQYGLEGRPRVATTWPAPQDVVPSPLGTPPSPLQATTTPGPGGHVPWDVYTLQQDLQVWWHHFLLGRKGRAMGDRVAARVASALSGRIQQALADHADTADTTTQGYLQSFRDFQRRITEGMGRHLTARQEDRARRKAETASTVPGAERDPEDAAPPVGPETSEADAASVTPTVSAVEHVAGAREPTRPSRPVRTPPDATGEFTTLAGTKGAVPAEAWATLRTMHGANQPRSEARAALTGLGLSPEVTNRLVDIGYNSLAKGDDLFPVQAPPAIAPPQPLDEPVVPQRPLPVPGARIANSGMAFDTQQQAEFALTHAKGVSADTHEAYNWPGYGWVILPKGTAVPRSELLTPPPATLTPTPLGVKPPDLLTKRGEPEPATLAPAELPPPPLPDYAAGIPEGAQVPLVRVTPAEAERLIQEAQTWTRETMALQRGGRPRPPGRA